MLHRSPRPHAPDVEAHDIANRPRFASSDEPGLVTGQHLVGDAGAVVTYPTGGDPR